MMPACAMYLDRFNERAFVMGWKVAGF